MSTVVDKSPPFLENFGYASLYAEDGREMHKSWGNAIEFNEAADRMGVDVMRWLFCAHKPENNLLFGYNRGNEVRRHFLIPLWNVYKFFVTYAKLDGWDPVENGFAESFDPAYPEGTAPKSDNPLDLWILGRLNQIVGKVTHALKTAIRTALRFKSTISLMTSPTGISAGAGGGSGGESRMKIKTTHMRLYITCW